MQNLLKHEAGQAQRVDCQRLCSGAGVSGGEGAAFEQDRDDQARDRDQCDSGRDGQDHGELGRPVHCIGGASAVACAEAAGKLGQQHDADCNSDDTKGKLIDAVGIGEP